MTIGNSVISIGDQAFSSCYKLTSVTIPDSVKYIGYNAFINCLSLASITIPHSVISIDSQAFLCGYLNCLVSVYYDAVEPISGSDDIFTAQCYENATLYVPAEGVEKCKVIAPWKNFAKIEAYIFDGLEDISNDIDFNSPYEIYNPRGLKIATSTENLPAGIYIIRQGLKTQKSVIK